MANSRCSLNPVRSAQPSMSRAATASAQRRPTPGAPRLTRSGQPLFDRVEESGSDVNAELPIQFTDSGRARDMDLGDVVADHIEPREEHALFTQDRADHVRQPAVA